MKIHPFAEIFPALEGKGFEALCEDIRQNGQLEKIKLFQGQIIDGRNRYNACKTIGKVPQYQDVFPSSPLSYVLSLNLSRRHLSESQRAMVADKIAKLTRGAPEGNKNAAKNKDANLHLCNKSENKDANLHLETPTRKEAAVMLNVSERSVASAKKIHEQGTPELVEKVERGDISVSAASKIADLPEEEQKEILEKAKESEEPTFEIFVGRIHSEKLLGKIRALSDAIGNAERAFAANGLNLGDYAPSIVKFNKKAYEQQAKQIAEIKGE